MNSRVIRILKDEELTHHFRQFLESCLCAENYDFWREIEIYKTISSIASRKEKALYIYSTYLAMGAPDEINLDASSKTLIVDRLFPVTQIEVEEKEEGSSGIHESLLASSSPDAPPPPPPVPNASAMYPYDLFDGAQQEVIHLLQNDMYERFMKSPFYLNSNAVKRKGDINSSSPFLLTFTHRIFVLLWRAQKPS